MPSDHGPALLNPNSSMPGMLLWVTSTDHRVSLPFGFFGASPPQRATRSPITAPQAPPDPHTSPIHSVPKCSPLNPTPTKRCHEQPLTRVPTISKAKRTSPQKPDLQRLGQLPQAQMLGWKLSNPAQLAWKPHYSPALCLRALQSFLRGWEDLAAGLPG